MKHVKSQSGMSLIWVLVISTALSIAMIQYSYESKIKRDSIAFQFTIAQIHNLLNMAYGYRLEHGNWPRNYRGDCEMPDQFLDSDLGFTGLNNGWGYRIEGVDDCDDLGDRYAIEQVVPEAYLGRFSEMLGEEISGSASGVPSGLVRMRIEFDESMAQEKLINRGKLARRDVNALTFDSIVCPVNQAASYVVGLDSACGYAVAIPFDGIIAPTPVFDGMIMGVQEEDGRQEVFYQMYVENGYGEDSLYYQNGEVFENDGMVNADERCPVNSNNDRYLIDAVLLSWCE